MTARDSKKHRSQREKFRNDFFMATLGGVEQAQDNLNNQEVGEMTLKESLQKLKLANEGATASVTGSASFVDGDDPNEEVKIEVESDEDAHNMTTAWLPVSTFEWMRQTLFGGGGDNETESSVTTEQ